MIDTARTAPLPRVLTVKHAFTELTLRARLGVAEVTMPRYGWLAPTLVVVLAAVLRLWNLGLPHAIVFDETYYAKDAYSLLHFGNERSWADEPNDAFLAGDAASVVGTDPAYVVHPPVGKWMIAAGMAVFGDDNPVGWRVAAALVGILSVALVAVAGWMLFRSLTVATIAAFLLAIDGHHLVQSRFALLDIFLMFWLLATFVCLLADRTRSRRLLARRVAEHAAAHGGLPHDSFMRYGPMVGVRWWRLAAGFTAGMAVGVKWNALFFIAVFGVMTVLWDLNARRIVGVRRWLVAGVFKDGVLAFTYMIVLGAGWYLLTWGGWFASDDGYNRRWAAEHPGEGVQWLPAALRSLWEYHRSAYEFHQGLDSDHTYESPAWKWLILARPTSYYYESLTQGVDGCAVEKCSAAVLNIGNPLIWWSFIAAILVALVVVLIRRDWRFIALLAVFLVGYLPWFMYPERTMFFFYALSFEPYLVLLLAGVLGLVLGRSTSSVRRRRIGVVLVGAYLVFATLLTLYFLPIWSAQVIPYEHWRWRMWFDSWI
ncbi:dolichyl-phosphate-mannose--protein mannosyltransferase [Rothia sp. ZJ1223]|uniref:dolichyl-phosphate-mannose--protein mannosyltransferase n=1 Tax=Rothia sp. ZJ1223 TaxID=2811098 RepID=UPI00351C0545